MLVSDFEHNNKEVNVLAPLVSVIVTSYNHGRYLTAALESVYKQTWKNIEVIVVDDASTDDSVKIIKRFEKKNKLKTIIRKENYYSADVKVGEKPIIEAMNSARGKYIAVVDSDDIILPGKIAHQVDLLEKNPHCSMCYSAIKVITPDGSIIPYNTTFLNGDVFDHMLVAGNLSLYIGSLIRRESYLQIKRSPPELVQEDWDMFLKLSKEGEVISSEKVVAYYRRHENNTWFRKDKSELMYRNRMMILDQWKHEPAWIDAINSRWKQYVHPDHMLSEKDVEFLLLEKPDDALLHFQGVLIALKTDKIKKAKYHIVQSIMYCDSRVNYLPSIYKIALKIIDETNIRKFIMRDLKNKLPNLHDELVKGGM